MSEVSIYIYMSWVQKGEDQLDGSAVKVNVNQVTYICMQTTQEYYTVYTDITKYHELLNQALNVENEKDKLIKINRNIINHQRY